jgi:hypothetical protein
MIRTQIQLTESQAEALRKLSNAKHVSVAELIRRSVDNLIKSSAITDTDEMKSRAIAAVGRFHSGKTDISASHDKYLAEDFS